MRFAYISRALHARQFEGASDADTVTALSATPLGRTPNPTRICTIIEIANIVGPMMQEFIQGFVWVPIPLPAICTTPPVSGAEAIEHAPIMDAVYDGLHQ
jgi:hypothetical protein